MQSANHDHEIRLSREMSLFAVTMIGVGAMIGAGIFVLTGIAAGIAGPALVLVFLLNGIVTFFTAMAYAELGSCFPDAGGGYLWVKQSLPGPNGFLSGWMSWFAHAVAAALYALGFGAYFNHLLGSAGITGFTFFGLDQQVLLAVGVCLLFTFVNYRGASEAGKAGSFVTVGKIVIIGIFILTGLFALFQKPDWTANFSNFLPNGFGAVLSAMGLTFIAFEGYEVIAQCSEEVENPRKNIPRAIFLSLLVVLPIYLLVAFVAIGGLDSAAMPTWQYLGLKKETAIVDAANQFFRWGGPLLLFGGLLSTVSALNATLFSSTRVAFAMARDHNLPDALGKIHPRTHVPHISLGFSALIIVFMVVALPIEAVASAADIMFLFLFVQVNIALLALRKQRPDLPRGFRVPFVHASVAFVLVSKLTLAFFLFRYSPLAVVYALGWIGLGTLFFFQYSSKKETAHKEKVAFRERLERKDYRVLVALAHPNTVQSLMEVGSAIAKEHAGEIVALAVREVDDDQLLHPVEGNDPELSKLLTQAAEVPKREGLPVETIINVSHRISRGIVETAMEEKCNLIVTGRKRRMNLTDRLFFSSVETSVRGASGELLVVVGLLPDQPIRNILLPLADDLHTQLCVELAPAFAHYFSARITPLSILSADAPASACSQRAEKVRKVLPKDDFFNEPVILRHRSAMAAICEQACQTDLILMGGETTSLVENMFFPPLAFQVAEKVTTPMVVVFEYEDRSPSWLARQFGFSRRPT